MIVYNNHTKRHKIQLLKIDFSIFQFQRSGIILKWTLKLIGEGNLQSEKYMNDNGDLSKDKMNKIRPYGLKRLITESI